MNQRATKWLLMATILITAGAVAALSRAEGTDVGVSESWMRPTLGANRNTAAYTTISNNGDSADRLIAASTAGARAVELHTAGMEDGIMRMRRVEDIEIPAGETVKLAPGGYHIMVMGLSEPIAAGTDVEITFTFEKAGNITAAATVSMTPPSGNGHGAMNHQMDHGGMEAKPAPSSEGERAMGSHAHH